MKHCGDWEERIALAAGGDLPEGGGLEVERHTAQCAGCREALASLRDELELLRQAHREPVAEAHFAAVRARVMAGIDVRRRRRGVWVAALAGAAALWAAVAWLKPARREAVPGPRPLAQAIARPQAPLPQATSRTAGPLSAAAAVTPGRRHAVARRTVRTGLSAQVRARGVAVPPLVVKLFTDDPNVVIYWIGDSD